MVGHHTIFDPIHGPIDIEKDSIVYDLIFTSPFQRLRHISQLGVSNYFFPGAVHNRYSHSIGTFHIGNLMLQRLGISLTDIDKKIYDAAFLLHDIGHFAFSHVFESPDVDVLHLENNGKSKGHHAWTEKIIMEDIEINEIFTKYGIEPANVISLLTEGLVTSDTTPNLLNLIDGIFDADRLDYLLRDSYFVGMPFSGFSLEHLIRSLEMKDDRLCLKSNYVNSGIAFLTSRASMYNLIYRDPRTCSMEVLFHNIVNRTRRLYKDDHPDISLIDLKTKDFFCRPERGEISLEGFYEILETSIIGTLKSLSINSNDPIIKKLSKILITGKEPHFVTLRDELSDKNIRELRQNLRQINNYFDEDGDNTIIISKGAIGKAIDDANEIKLTNDSSLAREFRWVEDYLINKSVPLLVVLNDSIFDNVKETKNQFEGGLV